MYRRFTRYVWVCLTALCCAGCTPNLTPPLTAHRTAPAPAVADAESLSDSTPILSPTDAVQLALARHPALAQVAHEQAVQLGWLQQADQGPNPRLGLGVEDFAGSGARQGMKQSETTLRLEQQLELGGKRAARRDAAQRSVDVSAWDLLTAQAEIRAQTLHEVVDLRTAQERRELADEVIRLDEKLVATVEKMVQAGRQHTAEAQRARAVLAAARIERARAAAEVEAARYRLAALWGSASPGFERILGDLPLAETDGQLAIDDNPDVLRAQAEIEQCRAQLSLAQAYAIPDVTVGAGVRQYGAGDDTALVFETSLPLPVRQRNAGAIDAARAQLAKAESAAAALRLQVAARARQAERQQHAARLELNLLRQEVVPATSDAYAAIARGHLEGRFRASEVLEAQRSWIAARVRLTEAQAEHDRAAIDLQRFQGGIR